MDSELEKWRERPLGEYPYLFWTPITSRFEKMDRSVIWRFWWRGGQPAGKREVLGVSVSLSEHEVHWRSFLESLKKRGLSGVELITSDDHAGLRAARLAVFGGIPWQRCQFHLQQNAQAYVPHKDMQAEVTEDIRTIFDAPDRTTAEAYLARTILKYRKMLPACQIGWRTICRKASRFFPFREVFDAYCARPMAWRDSTEKCAAERVW